MIADFIAARDYARVKNLWVVVVVPTEQAKEGLKCLSALSSGHPFGGRTLVMDSGRLSVALSSDEVFPAEPFQVVFTGWSGSSSAQAEDMKRWRQAATMVSRLI